MKWVSNSQTQNLAKKLSILLPKDFDPIVYMLMHPDLITNGVDSEQKSIEHYLFFGRKENRTYKKPILSNNIDYIPKPIPEIWNNNKNLLYFSPSAPDYDSSSGGNRLLQILKILKQDLGYNVWFMCNGYQNSAHIKILQDINIPIFLPNIDKQQYLDTYLQQAKNDRIEFGNAIFSWYDIGNQYIKIVQSYYPNIKILVDTVDVHWVREQRGKDTDQLNIPQESLDLRKNIEKSVYSIANVIFAITEDDKKHIQKELGYGCNIKILSNIHEKRNVKLGKDICFIGNYNHGPNADAALDCISIYKKFQQTSIYKKLKYKPKLLLAGPNLNESVINTISKDSDIKYLGQIQNLDDLYSSSSIMLVPLKWGAGIKGKICDAGMCGMPILTSSIGNEGIGFTDKHNALIANNYDAFVNGLEYFFDLNMKNQKILGIKGQEHLEKIVSKDSAKNILEHSLSDTPILISIVTYNQPVRLLKCLSTIIEKTKYSNYKIIVTDNSPNTKTYNHIKNYINDYANKISYIKSKTNNYFIAPNNNIMKDEQYKNYDIVLINDDIGIINDYWLNYLYSSVYSANYIAAAGGKTIFPDGRLAEAGAEIYSDGTGKNKGRYGDPKNIEYNIPHYTGYCSGCLLYMRRDAINKIGVFSTELEKMYYEDSEWQYRAHINGLKTIYDHRCEAIHDEGSSSGTDITKGTKKYQEINRIIFLELMKQYGHSNIENLN